MPEGRTRSALASRIAEVLEGSYAIEGEIGRGGMGVVYSARDLKLNRRVAIKILPPELAFRDEIKRRFLREAQTAARLQHPHIVPIHTVGDEGDLVYFVMGYVDGESLGQRLRRRKRLPVEEARRILKETADALGTAHALTVIHRDIKPDNILLEGTRRRVMVTDFGIAKALSDGGGLTGTGVALGTPSYMSPEQAAGDREVDARSDLYSLGVVGYEMICGELPFHAPTVPGILMKHVTEPPPDMLEKRPETPEELASSIMRCLEKDPGSRWPTADALRRALESRSSGPYRRPSGATFGGGHSTSRSRQASRTSGGRDRTGSARARTGAHRSRTQRDRRRDLPARRREREDRGQLEPKEPEPVRKFRGHFASYVSVNGCLLLLNVVTGIAEPWFLFPAIGWGIGIASSYGKLWAEGYSWRDVIHRPPAKDAISAPQTGTSSAKQLPKASSGDYGKYAGQVRQLQNDRAAIMQMVEKLSSSEKEMLPELVPTVEKLYSNAMELGQSLGQLEGDFDQASIDQLERRIGELEERDSDPELDRRLDLLRRQHRSMKELHERREKVEAKLESYVLAVQNMRFELLRLRSAGVAAALSDLTQATQQARALNLDVDAAIEAAGEIQEIIGKNTPRP